MRNWNFPVWAKKRELSSENIIQNLIIFIDANNFRFGRISPGIWQNLKFLSGFVGIPNFSQDLCKFQISPEICVNSKTANCFGTGSQLFHPDNSIISYQYKFNTYVKIIKFWMSFEHSHIFYRILSHINLSYANTLNSDRNLQKPVENFLTI